MALLRDITSDILQVFATLYIKTALEFVSFEMGYNKSYINKVWYVHSLGGSF